MDLTYVIPIRHSSISRTNNLFVHLEYLSMILPDMNVLVVEQDEQPAPVPIQVPHLFLFNNGLYNKGWGNNVAARELTSKVLAFADADVLTTKEAILQCYQDCAEGYDVSSPYKELWMLTEQETTAFRNTMSFIPPKREPSRANLAGGTFFIRRESLGTVGGYDERMRGYGKEDPLLSIKVMKCLNYVYRSFNTWHMWHAKTALDTIGQPNFEKGNKVVFEEVSQWSKEQILEHASQVNATNGRRDKYEV